MKEDNSGGGLPHRPDRSRSDVSELLENDRSESAINGMFQMGEFMLRDGKLPDATFHIVNEAVGVLLDGWHRDHTDSLVQDGVKVLQSHFARVFDLEPTASYRSVLGKALSSRYF